MPVMYPTYRGAYIMTTLLKYPLVNAMTIEPTQ